MTSLHTPRRLSAALGLLLLGLFNTTQAQTASAPLCRAVEVRNVRPGQGTVMVTAFLSAADFNVKRTASATVLAGSTDSVTLQVCGLSGSTMALTVLQDLNGNAQMDRNVLGVPIEPWGASANPSAFGAPTWESTQVPVDASPLVVLLSK